MLAIIGGGFCGLMTLYNLLQIHHSSLRILWIDGQGSTGRGTAYQQISESYLLNIQAQNMGALAGQPGHFWSWLQQRYPGRYQAQDYVPRQLYGDYLNQIAASVQRTLLRSQLELECLAERVVDLKQNPSGSLELRLEQGHRHQVDYLVLALGNQLPTNPQLADPLDSMPGYFQSPWNLNCLQELQAELPVLLLGSGLTSVDLILGLRERGFQGPIEVLSPHGYLPLPHRQTSVWRDFLAQRAWPQSLSQWLRLVRNEMQEAQQQDIDWRAVIDSLRPYFSQIWQSLSIKERKRFMRHLRHRWGVARHRLPASVNQKLQAWLQEGSVRVQAGRLVAVQRMSEAGGSGLKISWRPRLAAETRIMHVQRLINCTGPNGNFAELKDPLLSSLCHQGLLQPDPLGLGLLASPEGALLNQQGQASEQIFTLGSALRGMYWESTAVPELRQQAAKLAGVLSERLQKAALVHET